MPRDRPKNQAGPRPKTALHRILDEQLSTYALCAGAAAVSLTAAATRASAQIVYTQANFKLSCAVGQANCFDYAPIDPTHHGKPVFRLIDHIRTNNDGGRFPTGYSQYALLNIGVVEGLASVAANARGGPLAFKAGSAIGVSGQNWVNHGGSIYGPRMVSSERIPTFGNQCYADDGAGSSWKNVTNRFLGLKFSVNGETYYGWAEVSARQGNCLVSARLTGYAYNSDLGQPILAGQTASDQHRGTLGALALGSLGLGLWREPVTAPEVTPEVPSKR